jgi:hypothetical protein
VHSRQVPAAVASGGKLKERMCRRGTMRLGGEDLGDGVDDCFGVVMVDVVAGVDLDEAGSRGCVRGGALQSQRLLAQPARLAGAGQTTAGTSGSEEVARSGRRWPRLESASRFSVTIMENWVRDA